MVVSEGSGSKRLKLKTIGGERGDLQLKILR